MKISQQNGIAGKFTLILFQGKTYMKNHLLGGFPDQKHFAGPLTKLLPSALTKCLTV